MNTFAHPGGFAALVFCLPVVRALGGGRITLYPAAHTTHPMTRERGGLVAGLLARQPYVRGVEWRDRPAGVDLGGWRARAQNDLNISDTAAQTFGAPFAAREEPWLFADPRKTARVVFHRSLSRHNWNFPWRRVWEAYRGEAVFVGLPEEHQDFCTYVGPVDYVPTADLHDLARVIAGAELFVGNQAAPFAIAEGLKVPTILELYHAANVFHWERRGNLHGWGGDVAVPALGELADRYVASVVARADGRTLIGDDRLTVLAREARATAHLPGDMAELGVCRGGSAKVVSSVAPHKLLHLFDTFRGLPADDQAAGGHAAGEFAADLGEVKVFLAGYRVAFHVGVFPDTTAHLPAAARFSFVHLDADIYQSTRAAIEYFWPRVVPGGVVVFDDYGWPRCPGVARAVAECLPGLPVEVGPYQAVVRKPDRARVGPARRTVALDRVLRAFQDGGGRRVVTVGCPRDAREGHPALVFAGVAEDVYAVDPDPAVAARVRQQTAEYGTVAAVAVDGAKFLDAFDLPVDLLYVGPGPDPLAPADGPVAAYRAARRHFFPTSLLVVAGPATADNPVVRAAVSDGWEVVFTDTVTLLRRPPAGRGAGAGPQTP